MKVLSGILDRCLIATFFLVFLNVCLCQYNAFAQSLPQNFAGLSPYKIGFQTKWLQDPARSFTHNADTINRPVLFNMWYPVKRSVTVGSAMHYQDYFDYDRNSKQLSELSENYKNYNLSILAEQFFDKTAPELSRIDKNVLKNFLNNEARVYKNAPYADGSFPLIIYHQGFGASVEDNSGLATYLASNGYVVIGSSFFGETDQNFGVDGRSESIRDISFLIDHAKEIPMIDTSRIALAGHSGGAQASVLAKAVLNHRIEAVISLDTTQDMFGLSDSRWDSYTKPVVENIANMNSALLAFADHRAVFELFNRASKMDRYYITTPAFIGHNEFVSQGIYRNYLNYRVLRQNSKEGSEDAFIEAKFKEWYYNRVNFYILNFLDIHLKKEPEKEHLFREGKYGSETDFNELIARRVLIGETGPPPYTYQDKQPPTPDQLWRIAQTDKIKNVVEVLKKFDMQIGQNPIYDDIFAFALLYQLVEDDQIVRAKKLYQYYVEIGAPVTDRFFSLANFSLLMRRTDYAKNCMHVLLKLDPNNKKASQLLKEFENKPMNN
ncbi:MAG: hypothetical protein ABJK11_08360 [Balneola sp.]